jgi:hypothetical protein
MAVRRIVIVMIGTFPAPANMDFQLDFEDPSQRIVHRLSLMRPKMSLNCPTTSELPVTRASLFAVSDKLSVSLLYTPNSLPLPASACVSACYTST